MYKKILFCIVLTQHVLHAQNTSKLLSKANELLQNGRFRAAIPMYEDILKFEPDHQKANYYLGICLLEVSEKYQAHSYLQKAYNTNNTLEDIDYYLAKAYHFAYKFDEAIKFYKIGLSKTDPVKQKNKYNYVLKKIEECEHGKNLTAYPVKAIIDNMGPVINSKYHDYAPVLSIDEQKLVFTSRRYGASQNNAMENGDFYEDIYISTKKDGKWTEPVNIGNKANTDGHDASIAISPDGLHIFIYRDDNGGDIFITDYDSQQWSEARPLDKRINTKYNESSLSMAANGRTIYFTSDKPGGYGGKDIYKSTKDSKGNYTEAVNLGPQVNTPYDDDAPFIQAEGTTLYFSSKGHKTIGGFDIFKTENIDGKWTTPENLGYPINSTDDDIYFVISTDNKRGYYASSKPGGLGENDLYMISMPQPETMPKFVPLPIPKFAISAPIFPFLRSTEPFGSTPFAIYKGSVADENGRNPLVAKIIITDNTFGTQIQECMTDAATGGYEIPLLSGNNYGIRVEKDPYIFYSENIDVPFSHQYQLLLKDIAMKKMSVGTKIILKNIFFEINKATLRSESVSELDRLYDLLIENSHLIIEISGHTDNQGAADHNKRLSHARAKAVVDYLVKKGIVKDRLRYVGYGMEKPMADNTTESGRQMNRRTEFEIISN